jgi:pSer/pThr/pTyr-binding forkhead associated (FHA) protein
MENFQVDVVLRSQDGSEYVVTDGAVLGRVAGVEIVIADPKVSRQHAKFTLSNGTLAIEDLGSSNGTLVNGTKINLATPLVHGDTVSIEHLSFRVIVDGEELAELDEVTVIGAASDDSTVIGAPAADLGNVPGSWVESDASDSTQFLSPGQRKASEAKVTRQSLEPHLILLDGLGGIAEALGLDLGDLSDQQWEIGRGEQCDVRLTESTVSTRHAQLVCEGGKWRIVNLISSNGIMVNGEKRLSAFLSDGDVIGLGQAQLVFFGPSHTSQISSSSSRGTEAGVNKTVLLTVGAAVILAAIAAVALL